MMPNIKEHSKKLEDIVITSVVKKGENYLCTGTLLDEWYKTILLEIDEEGSVLWKKPFGDDQVDYEGQDLLAMDDGYLVCGGSEGVASKSGGRDWKAYILKTDKSGDNILYRSYNISGNDVAWSVIEDDDGFLLLGEARGGDSKSIFVLKVDDDGNKIWKEDFASGKKALSCGILKTEDGYVIAGSIDQGDGWNNVLLKVGKDGRSIWERFLDRGITYDICSLDNQMYLTGCKDDKFYVICLDKNGELNWEKSFFKGRGLRILPLGGSIVIGGEIGEKPNPVLYKIDSKGKVEWVQDYEYEGWIETFVKTKWGYLLFIFGLEPREHTRVMHVKNNGAPTL